jgi:dTDP-4-amino-4,6-dideoxygalactose transaminase
MKVPFVSLERQYVELRNELMAEFDRVGRSGIYIMGETLELFEREAADFCGTRFAVGLANGSDALFLALKALGIGPGDEVITCPNSFIATAWTIVAAGATPIFVDSKDDYNIDPDKILKSITTKTRAIMPIHLTGRVADMDAINSIAEKHGLSVIEDAAQALGAEYKNKRAGSLGAIGCFSLHPLKNLGVYGDGGLLTTDREDIYREILKLRNHGLINRDECELWGYNSRLDSLQAAFASIKLRRLNQWNSRYREIATYYRDSLSRYVWVPCDQPYEMPVYHNFVIRTPKRDSLRIFLDQHGVETRIHYPIPIHLQRAAQAMGHKKGDFPVVESQIETMLSLPIYPELRDDEMRHVVETIKSFNF